MASTTSTRETRIEDLAERYGFSAEAAHVLNVAVAQGHGNMAAEEVPGSIDVQMNLSVLHTV